SNWADLLAVAGDVRDRLGPDRGRVPPDAWQSALDEIEPLVGPGNHDAMIERLYDRLAASIETAPVAESLFPLGERRNVGVSEAFALSGEQLVNGAENALTLTLSQRERGQNNRASAEGLVSLVGAGPGDPELLTMRAL